MSNQQFVGVGGGKLLKRYNGSLIKLLQTAFPELHWNSYRFSRPHHLAPGSKKYSKTQQLLCNYMKTVFPGVAIGVNHQYEADGRKRAMEFDVSNHLLVITRRYLFPLFHWQLNIMANIITNTYHCILNLPLLLITCIHHSDTITARDMKKRSVCKEHGITLITIPYWWNKTIESIAATISEIRPDISIPEPLSKGNVIPLHNPKEDHEKRMKLYAVSTNQLSALSTSKGNNGEDVE